MEWLKATILYECDAQHISETTCHLASSALLDVPAFRRKR